MDVVDSATPEAETPGHAGPLPDLPPDEAPAAEPASPWHEPRDVDEIGGDESRNTNIVPRPAWWEAVAARPGAVAAALAAGVIIGLAGGYALWGGRPAASSATPAAATMPAASPREDVTEPALNVAAPSGPAPEGGAPPVPAEAADERRESASPATRPSGATSVPPAPSKTTPSPARATPAAPKTAVAAPKATAPAPKAATAPPRRGQAAAVVPRTPQAAATLDVDSRPQGARVLVDGKSVGKTPLHLDTLAPGRHVVRLELQGHAPWSTTVTVTAGRPARVAGSLERVQR